MYEDEDKTHCGDRNNVTPLPGVSDNTVLQSRCTVLRGADDHYAGLSRLWDSPLHSAQDTLRFPYMHFLMVNKLSV